MPRFVFSTLALLLCLSRTVSAQQASPNESQTRQRIVVLPVLGAAPETGAQFGVALFVTRHHADSSTRPSSLVGNAIRTAKSQTRVFMDIDKWTSGNRWRFLVNTSWQQFPLLYYGVSDSAPDTAEEAYTPRGTELALTMQRLIAPSIWLQAGARRIEQEIVRAEPGLALSSGNVLGSRGGRTVLTSAGLVADTRDNLFAATAGHFVELTGSIANDAIGSEFDFQRVRLDARAYRSIRSSHVVAAQLLVQGTAGDPPFDQLALIGSSSAMRGYAAGRYRDRWMTAAQAEYRSPTVRKFGAAVFGGGALIASTAGDLSGGELLPTFGAGLRYRLDAVTRATVRVDYAFGRSGQSGLYVAFSEAF
jgi:outer membrane protein assembly factor BamA